MRNRNRIFHVTTVSIAALFLSACGSSDTNWGIDRNNNSIPKCSSNIDDTSAAIKVLGGTKVKSLSDDTSMRVWHYSNSDKLVCVITGQAIIVKDK